MPEVSTDEAVTDSIVTSEEGLRDFGVALEPLPGMIYFAFSPFSFSLLPFTDIFFFFFFSCQLTCHKIPTTLNHPWMQLLTMQQMNSWRLEVLCRSSRKVFYSNNLDNDFFYKIIFIPFSSFIGRL